MIKFRFDALPRWLRDVVPLIGWMALIFALSSRQGFIEIDNPASERFVFKGAHVLVYALLAWLWWRVLSPQRRASWSVLVVAWFLATLYGVSDEIHQRFVPGRHGQVADVLFDSAGALAMIIALRWVARLRILLHTERN